MERQTSDDFSEEEADDLEMEVKEEGAGGSGFFNQEVAAIIGDQIQIQSVGPAGTSLQIRRSRPKEEKERTKLRERHRRAITARILSGLRRHGNYNLRVRADINDVISALAREAGWVVEPDGTTLPSSLSNAMGSPIIAQDGGQAATTPLATMPSAVVTHTPPLRAISSPSSAISLQNCRLKAVYTPPMSHDKQVMNAHARIPEQDYAGTPYVPVYIMMPIGVINKKCELVNPEGIMKDLRSLKDTNVDGIIVDCWWGIVEAHYPQKYNWDGYKRLFQIVRELKLKLQVVMSFHECRDDLGDDVHIPLPHWITEIGKVNPDIFFTDKDGRRNYECLTWGIDKERVLRGRNAIDVYFDFMRSFCTIFNQYFDDGIISEVRVGLGPCGELRYPSYPIKHGWRYPGIGGFQSYDQYLMKSLRKAAEARGQPNWIVAPLNAGSYNSQPGDTVFFCDGGEYDNSYGRFFLGWYSKILVDHADSVLYLAKVIFQGTIISATIPGIHWWYRTTSHAAELVAGFYNSSNRDGYAPETLRFRIRFLRPIHATMPRYYCDYCDTYLTHDSPSVRKQHNAGFKHKANVRTYYQQFEEQQNQSLIDQKIKEHLGQAAVQYQQVGATFNQFLHVNPQMPRLPVLPLPMMPMGVPPQMTMAPQFAPGIRPPILQPPVSGAPGYGAAPMQQLGATSMPMQMNNIPMPPMMNPPPNGNTTTPTSTAATTGTNH